MPAIALVPPGPVAQPPGTATDPVLLATSYLPLPLVAGSAITREDTGPGGTYARLAELGHEPVHFREEIRSRMPSPDEVTQLDLAPGTPVILICRTAFTGQGRAVEVNEMTLDAGSYVLEYDFDAGPGPAFLSADATAPTDSA